jgi:hypothetical protein
MEGTGQLDGDSDKPLPQRVVDCMQQSRLGVLHRELIEGPQPVDSTIRILVAGKKNTRLYD